MFLPFCLYLSIGKYVDSVSAIIYLTWNSIIKIWIADGNLPACHNLNSACLKIKCDTSLELSAQAHLISALKK